MPLDILSWSHIAEYSPAMPQYQFGTTCDLVFDCQTPQYYSQLLITPWDHEVDYHSTESALQMTQDHTHVHLNEEENHRHNRQSLLRT
jgi:hypothetical protein